MDLSVLSAQDRINALETKAKAAFIAQDPELQSQLARFLCVLTSGLLEQAVISILESYVNTRSQSRVRRYAGYQLSRLQNAKFEDILHLLGRFDPAWRLYFENTIPDEVKAAIDSIVNNRNQIAHGKQVNISLGTFSQYFLFVKGFLIALESYLATQ